MSCLRKQTGNCKGCKITTSEQCGVERGFWRLQSDTNSSSCSGSVKDLYYELLYAVGKKYPGESRHETALRYIQSAEAGSNIPGCDKSNEEG